MGGGGDGVENQGRASLLDRDLRHHHGYKNSYDKTVRIEDIWFPELAKKKIKKFPLHVWCSVNSRAPGIYENIKLKRHRSRVSLVILNSTATVKNYSGSIVGEPNFQVHGGLSHRVTGNSSAVRAAARQSERSRDRIQFRPRFLLSKTIIYSKWMLTTSKNGVEKFYPFLTELSNLDFIHKIVIKKISIMNMSNVESFII